MLRKTLLATTALVLGTSVAFAMHVNAPVHKAARDLKFGTAGHVVNGHAVNFSIGNTKNLPPIRNNKEPVMGAALYNNFSKSANARFISWYGFRMENSGFSSYYSSHDFFKDNFVANNAVGFTTTGGALKNMSFGGFTYSANDEIQGQILSDSGGLPGNMVAQTASTTESDTPLCCTSLRTVKFKPAGTLAAGSYFATVVCVNKPCNGGWAMEDTDFSGGTVDYYHFVEQETYRFPSYTKTVTYHYSSPWHASTYYPTAGAVEIK